MGWMARSMAGAEKGWEGKSGDHCSLLVPSVPNSC